MLIVNYCFHLVFSSQWNDYLQDYEIYQLIYCVELLCIGNGLDTMTLQLSNQWVPSVTSSISLFPIFDLCQLFLFFKAVPLSWWYSYMSHLFPSVFWDGVFYSLKAVILNVVLKLRTIHGNRWKDLEIFLKMFNSPFLSSVLRINACFFTIYIIKIDIWCSVLFFSFLFL